MSLFKVEALKHGIELITNKKLAVCESLRSKHRCNHNCDNCVWKVNK